MGKVTSWWISLFRRYKHSPGLVDFTWQPHRLDFVINIRKSWLEHIQTIEIQPVTPAILDALQQFIDKERNKNELR